ncbi:hypothetical protein [Brucella oryzae]|uniref:Uncharacterized protein n=1 Tax=Brucella oryzae TaxID=335286 RepID=A0A2S7J358_9HYPH|nr:hypothetical protein [Brucella oryzae]PQA74681.1 hypothetical protein C3731_05475 [Brucella oryzae]
MEDNPTGDRQVMGMNIDMKLIIGNVITIGVVVVGITGNYYAVKSGVDQSKIDITKLETRIERLETQNGDVRDRMTRMEVTLQNMAINLDRVVRFVDSTEQRNITPRDR